MKLDTQTVVISSLFLIGAYFFTQGNGNNSGSATGNFTQNGTIQVPGLGTLPASQQANGLVYVKLNGQWILLSALQTAYEQGQGSSSNGGGFGAWLNNNSGQLLGIAQQIINIFQNPFGGNTGGGLALPRPRGVIYFRPF